MSHPVRVLPAPAHTTCLITCLITCPTGLDTFKAYKVVKILSVLAKNYGRTVVATIHQPSSEIFHLFDDLILLAEGQVGPQPHCWHAAAVYGFSAACRLHAGVPDQGAPGG
jgi:hypothetical protein